VQRALAPVRALVQLVLPPSREYTYSLPGIVFLLFLLKKAGLPLELLQKV
jgi:hypothetical protein